MPTISSAPVLPIQLALGNDGLISAGAVASFYLAGTTTPTPVYNSAGVSLGTSLTADSAGRFVPFYLDVSLTYKIDLKDSNGVSLSGYPVDNWNPVPSSSSSSGGGLNIIQIDALLG